MADIKEAPGSLCPLCGQEEGSLDINLFLIFAFFLFPLPTSRAVYLHSIPSHQFKMAGRRIPSNYYPVEHG